MDLILKQMMNSINIGKISWRAAPWPTRLLIISYLWLFTLFASLFILPASFHIGALWGSLAFLAPVLLMIFATLKRDKHQRELKTDTAMQAAQQLGYTYTFEISDTLPGNLFKEKVGQYIHDVLSGTYRNFAIRIFSWEFLASLAIAKENSARNLHQYTVYELKYARPLPHILITSKLSQSVPILVNLERDALEGSFGDLYDVYVEHGSRIELREIFTPDKMMSFVKSFAIDSMECVDSHIFIMRLGTFASIEQYSDFLNACNSFVDTIAPTLAAVSVDWSAVH